MFANFLELFTRKPDDRYEHAFVKDVVVRPPPARSRSVERILLFGWILIAFKCAVVWWACRSYSVPVDPWWIIAPTLFMAALCTLIYWRRR